MLSSPNYLAISSESSPVSNPVLISSYVESVFTVILISDDVLDSNIRERLEHVSLEHKW